MCGTPPLDGFEAESEALGNLDFGEFEAEQEAVHEETSQTYFGGPHNNSSK